jgi:hypothetical protein
MTENTVSKKGVTSVPNVRLSRVQRVLQSFRSNPGYTLMRGVARFTTVRQLVAISRGAFTTKKKNEYLASCESRMRETQFPKIDRRSFVSELRRNGVAFGLKLPAQTVEAIHRYADNAPCYADRVPAQGFMLDQRAVADAALGKPILVAQYFNTAIACPDIGRLVDDPMLQAIACEYLESAPTFVGANLWWTFPVNALEADREQHAHLFHRDVDDFRFFKFFFYLTDVVAGDGGHVCVIGSHHRPPQVRFGDRWNIRRYTDTEISDQFSANDIQEICGQAGTGFGENTLCVHKGRTPTTHPRLLLQLQFALFDYGAMHDRRDSEQLRRMV